MNCAAAFEIAQRLDMETFARYDAEAFRRVHHPEAIAIFPSGRGVRVAALHSGLVIPGPSEQAAMYEGSLGVILTIVLGLTFLGPGAAGVAGLAAQALAFAGASVGLYLALLGVAPDTPLDIAYHVSLIALLVAGLVVAWRVRAS